METTNPNYRLYFRIVAVIAIIFLIFSITRECQHRADLATIESINKAITDTIVITRNEKGQSTGTTSVIEDVNPDYFLTIQSKDRMITTLQKLVKEYESKIKQQGSITLIASEGTIDVTSPTTVDSTDKSSLIYRAPFELKDKKGTLWAWGNTVARKDSTQVNLKYRDTIDVLIGKEKTGFLGLGKGKSFAQITFHNPYNEVKDMKVYQTKPEESKNWHVGPAVMWGIGMDLITQFFIGIGIMWTPFNF